MQKYLPVLRTMPHWFFPLRAKEINGIASGLDLPDTPEFDLPVQLSLCRRQTKYAIQRCCCCIKKSNCYKNANCYNLFTLRKIIYMV